jgi:hypothetical protein
MSRRSALPRAINVLPGAHPDTIDDRSPSPSYPRTRRGKTTRPVRGARLISEVVELAFDACDAADCTHSPDGICGACGSLMCREHAAPADGTRTCPACDGVVHDLLTAAVDLVIDARFRRG